jgi:LysM repeat protein
MERRTLPKRNAWAIIAIVHVGIVLLLVTMGGCRDKTRERDDMGTPDTGTVEDLGGSQDYPVVEKDVGADTGPAVVVRDTPHVKETVTSSNDVRYVVQAGDSLWKISRKFGVTVDAIADRNDIQDPTLIRVGRELWIPNPTKNLDEASTAPSTGGSEAVVTQPETGTSTTPVEPVDLSTIQTFDYEVQPGDTIWKLARTYKTTTQIIMQLNGITDAKTLRAGQTIKIPKEVQDTPVQPPEETGEETPEETLEPVIQ